MAFSIKKTDKVVNISTFASRMSNIKSMFKIAHENASNLHAEMEEEIKNKSAQIASLQSDIQTINTTKKEAEEFMENISKLI